MSGDGSPGGGRQRREGVRQEPAAGGEGGGQHCPGGTRGLHVHREGPSTSGIVLLKVVGHSVRDPEPDPHVFRSPGSGTNSQIYVSASGSCSGSFPFLINVWSGLKDFLQNKILTQNFSKKFDF